MKLITHWINGKPWDGTPARTGPVFDPATGAQQAEVALASVADVDAAVESSKQAFATWRDSSLSTRASIMFRFRELDRKTDEWRAPKIAIVRYKKSGGVFRKQSNFNISSEKQARAIIETLERWFDGAGDDAGDADSDD